MASKSSPKSVVRMQKAPVSGTASPPDKNTTRSTSPRARADLQSSENRKQQCRSPKTGLLKAGSPTSAQRSVSPSGKKKQSPNINSVNDNNLHTMDVDCNMVSAKQNIVSPGRQCMSDSKLTVRSPSRNIPVSNHHKRKLDLDDACLANDSTVPLGLPKRRKQCSEGEIVCNSLQAESDQLPKNHLTVDWNQNEKSVTDNSIGKRRKSWSETSPDSYKHSHSIGKRISPKTAKFTEYSLSNWRVFANSNSKVQNNHKDVSATDGHTNSISPKSAKMQNGQVKVSPTSNGEPKRPSYSHSISNDSVFEDNGDTNEKDDDKFEKVDNEVAFNRTFGVKNDASESAGKGMKQTGRSSPKGNKKPKERVLKGSLSNDVSNGLEEKHKESASESAGSESIISSCTEDSLNDDVSVAGKESLCSPDEVKPKKRRHKFADTLPPRAPRARREASLTAETKVHLLYERDDMDRLPAKKPRLSQSENVPLNNGLHVPPQKPNNGSIPNSVPVKVESKPPVKNDEEAGINKGRINGYPVKLKMKVAPKKQPSDSVSVSKVVNFVESPQLTMEMSQTCKRCGKPLKPSCNTAQGEQRKGVKPDSSSSCGRNSNSSSTSETGVQEGSKTSQSAASNALLCNCPLAQRSVSEPAADSSIMDALVPLLGQPRRASVDAAECEKLTQLKGAFLLRLARHSVDAPNAIANQLSSLPSLTQLEILQPGNLNTSNATPTNGGHKATVAPSNGSNGANNSTVIEFVSSKSKAVRKIVKQPGLKPFKRRKSTNGWRGEGEPVQKPVIINSEAIQEVRYCYEAIRRKDDVIKIRDCVLLRAGPRKRDLPFVAKVASIYEDPDTGDLMMSLLWYYRPEHTEAGRLSCHLENELFACRHWDINSVACIEDKCYVVTLAEYNRFCSKLQMALEGIRPQRQHVPDPADRYPRRTAVPPQGFEPESVFFCRQVYDFRQRRVLKNPY